MNCQHFFKKLNKFAVCAFQAEKGMLEIEPKSESCGIYHYVFYGSAKIGKPFKSEFEILKNLKIIVALGKIAFDTCVKFYRENFDYTERVKFGHGSYFKLPNDVLLMGCYHPSPRNVNTGRINEKQMTQLFKKVKQLV